MRLGTMRETEKVEVEIVEDDDWRKRRVRLGTTRDTEKVEMEIVEDDDWKTAAQDI